MQEQLSGVPLFESNNEAWVFCSHNLDDGDLLDHYLTRYEDLKHPGVMDPLNMSHLSQFHDQHLLLCIVYSH